MGYQTKSKHLFAAFMAATMMLTACSSGQAKSNEDSIKIGANFELSGAVSSYGNAELEGVKLAVEQINANGGVLGKQIQLVELDNKSDVAETTSVATRLTDKEKVVATVGPATSGLTKASISVANEAKVPLVSPSATDDGVTVTNNGTVQPYGYRISFQDSFQGRVMAQFANEKLNSKNALIIMDNSSDYAAGLTKTFKSVYAGNVVATESYAANDTDFSAIVTKVKGMNFDTVFIPGYYGEAGLIIKALREAGVTAPIIGADGFDSPELINLAGAKNLNDVYFSAHYTSLDQDPKVQSFIADYKAKYSKDPNTFAALGYDTMYLLADAIERAGTTNPEDINKALESTKDFSAVTGSITIDEMHNPVKSANVITLKDGVATEATKVKP